VNFLNSGPFGLTVSDLSGLGVRRISVGGSLARVAWTAFIRAAREIADKGTFENFAARDAECRAQRLLPRRPGTAGAVMTLASEPDPATGRPVGLEVDATPARLPGLVVLEGRFGRLEKLAAHHAASLWDAVKDNGTLWPYMAYGPF